VAVFLFKISDHLFIHRIQNFLRFKGTNVNGNSHANGTTNAHTSSNGIANGSTNVFFPHPQYLGIIPKLRMYAHGELQHSVANYAGWSDSDDYTKSRPFTPALTPSIQECVAWNRVPDVLHPPQQPTFLGTTPDAVGTASGHKFEVQAKAGENCVYGAVGSYEYLVGCDVCIAEFRRTEGDPDAGGAGVIANGHADSDSVNADSTISTLKTSARNGTSALGIAVDKPKFKRGIYLSTTDLLEEFEIGMCGVCRMIEKLGQANVGPKLDGILEQDSGIGSNSGSTISSVRRRLRVLDIGTANGKFLRFLKVGNKNFINIINME
jgi:hypothetical protein